MKSEELKGSLRSKLKQKLIRKFKPRMFMKYRWLPLKRTLVLRLICFECNVKCLKTRISSDDRFNFNQNFCFNFERSDLSRKGGEWLAHEFVYAELTKVKSEE
jgi:hypothetical protein